MSSANNDEIISHASPHTIKKFDLIEKYVEAWAQILALNKSCKCLIFIDCMSNSGEYYDDDGNQVFGTPIRVAKILRKAAGQYYPKKFFLYFNDRDEKKIAHLKGLLPGDTTNFKIITSTEDGNDLLKRIGSRLDSSLGYHYLLVYDPYDARIDWPAILPFLNNWGEVIINHMVSDSIRAVKQAKTDAAIGKYEGTYLSPIEDLIPLGSDKKAFEARVEQIIYMLHRRKQNDYHVAAFPFFNVNNAIVYNLIHCTGHIQGFKLYKKTAWQVFGGKSSTKNTHGREDQYVMDFSGTGVQATSTDEYCYYVKDIAEYLQKAFAGQTVSLDEIWAALDEHPIFPSEGFRKEIKQVLTTYYGASEARGRNGQKSTITFLDRGCKS